MKIETKDTIKFLNSPFNVMATLLWGNDLSSVETKQNSILDKARKENYEIIEIKQSELINQATLLVEKFLAISMFSKKKKLFTLSIIDSERRGGYERYISPIFKKEGIKSDNYILITIVNTEEKELVNKTSSIIKFCEKEEKIASIVCYEEKDIESYTTNKLKEYGFQFSSEVVDYIIKNTNSNKLIINNEIFKLSQYFNDIKKIDIESIKKCIKNQNTYTISDIIEAFTTFNKEKLIASLEAYLDKHPNEFNIIVRSLISHFIKLQRYSTILKEEKIDMTTLMTKEKIFWKSQSLIQNNLKTWKIESINIFIDQLLELEKHKTEPSKIDQKYILENFLIGNIGYFSRKR